MMFSQLTNSPPSHWHNASPHLELLPTVTSSFKLYSVAGRLLYSSCALLYLLHYFCRASSIVSLSLAFVIIGLTRTAFVRTRSTHTLVPWQLDLRKTSLPPVSLKAQISPLLVLGALNSGRARCNPGKTPLAPRNRTWTRDRHQSQLASPRLRQQSSLQTRMCLRFYSLRHLASWYPTQKTTQKLSVLLGVQAIPARIRCLMASSLPPRWRARMTIRGSRSLVASIRQSFTWILAIPVDNLTCASRTEPSVPSAGEGQVLLSLLSPR